MNKIIVVILSLTTVACLSNTDELEIHGVVSTDTGLNRILIEDADPCIIEMVRYAIRTWEDVCGEPMFQIEYVSEGAAPWGSREYDTIVRKYDREQWEYDALAVAEYPIGGKTGEIKFINELCEYELRFPTSVHEFGHALGLAHDENSESIMYGEWISHNQSILSNSSAVACQNRMWEDTSGYKAHTISRVGHGYERGIEH